MPTLKDSGRRRARQLPAHRPQTASVPTTEPYSATAPGHAPARISRPQRVYDPSGSKRGLSGPYLTRHSRANEHFSRYFGRGSARRKIQHPEAKSRALAIQTIIDGQGTEPRQPRMSTSVTATPRSNHKTDPPMCVSARAPAFPPFAWLSRT